MVRPNWVLRLCVLGLANETPHRVIHLVIRSGLANDFETASCGVAGVPLADSTARRASTRARKKDELITFSVCVAEMGARELLPLDGRSFCAKLICGKLIAHGKRKICTINPLPKKRPPGCMRRDELLSRGQKTPATTVPEEG